MKKIAIGGGQGFAPDFVSRLLKEGWTFPNFDYEGDFLEIADKIYNCNAILVTGE